MLSFIGKWLLNILIAIDQLVNAVAFGDHDETMSSRAGKIKLQAGDDFTWWRHPIAKFVDKLTALFQRRHVERAIEWDEGKDQLL